MGYVEKKTLMDYLRMDSHFSADEVSLLDKLIKAHKIYDNEAVMDSWALSQIEKNGLRDRFLAFCDRNNWFQVWVRNAKEGID